LNDDEREFRIASDLVLEDSKSNAANLPDSKSCPLTGGRRNPLLYVTPIDFNLRLTESYPFSQKQLVEYDPFDSDVCV
jgi:hypothetical protein